MAKVTQVATIEEVTTRLDRLSEPVRQIMINVFWQLLDALVYAVITAEHAEDRDAAE